MFSGMISSWNGKLLNEVYMTELIPLQNPSAGYVYILSNPSMPCILKIGMTRRGAAERAEELYTTGVPTPFKIEFEIYSADCRALEARAHELLDDKRASNSREFFIIDKDTAIMELTSAYLEHQECVALSNEFYDIERVLYEMHGKAGIEHLHFGSTINMFRSLEFLDPKAILKASIKYEIFLEEASKKRRLEVVIVRDTDNG